jgi:hypothetical protein
MTVLTEEVNNDEWVIDRRFSELPDRMSAGKEPTAAHKAVQTKMRR